MTILELPIFIQALHAQAVRSGLDFWPNNSVRIAVANLSTEILDFPLLVMPHTLAKAHVIFIVEDCPSTASSVQVAAIVEWANSQKILALVVQAKEADVQILLNDFGGIFGNMGETAICAMVDFADIFDLLDNSSSSTRLITGGGQASGINRVETAVSNTAARIKLKCGTAQLNGAVAIAAFNRETATLREAALAMKLLRKFLPPKCGFVYGFSYAADLGADEIRLTVLATVVECPQHSST